MSVTCEICGKEFKTPQGLRGHKTFVHQMNSSQDSPTQPATEQRFNILEDRLSKLEYITGLEESYSDISTDELLDGTKPITDRLGNITEQLTKLSSTVSKLSEQVNLAQSTRSVKEERALSELKKEYEMELNGMTSIVNQYRDEFNHNLIGIESRIAGIQKVVQGLGKDLNAARAKLFMYGDNNLSSIPGLALKINKVEQTIDTLQSRIEYLVKLSKREPTGHTVQLMLNDHKEHSFREYKSVKGLVKPYQSSYDLILGKRWVDLAEPEN